MVRLKITRCLRFDGGQCKPLNSGKKVRPSYARLPFSDKNGQFKITQLSLRTSRLLRIVTTPIQNDISTRDHSNKQHIKLIKSLRKYWKFDGEIVAFQTNIRKANCESKNQPAVHWESDKIVNNPSETLGILIPLIREDRQRPLQPIKHIQNPNYTCQKWTKDWTDQEGHSRTQFHVKYFHSSQLSKRTTRGTLKRIEIDPLYYHQSRSSSSSLWNTGCSPKGTINQPIDRSINQSPLNQIRNPRKKGRKKVEGGRSESIKIISIVSTTLPRTHRLINDPVKSDDNETRIKRIRVRNYRVFLRWRAGACSANKNYWGRGEEKRDEEW